MSYDLSPSSRTLAIKRMSQESFDLLIVGGGVTGASLAREASVAGLKVALIEKADFASGTSSKSSKLIHGGLRYLENAEFRLVFEALSERSYHLREASNHVEPLRFWLPVLPKVSKPSWMLGVGLFLYDCLSFAPKNLRHRRRSRDRLLKALPGLSSKVQTGFAYYDALMNDDLLVIDILRHAQSMGASVANYVEATDPIIQQNQIEGYSVLDHETGNRINVRAKLTVLCTGPWADIERARLGLQPLLKPSQGVHFVIPHSRLPIDGALMMIHPTDGRIAFAIARPDWGEGMTLVGTTDGPTNPDPHKARVTNAEVQYLLDLLGFYFPSRSLGLRDILSAYVGIRPLVAPATNDKSLAKVSREHHIERLQAGLWQVAGGKYTTHRTMAWDILDALMASSEGSFLNKYSWHKKTNSMAYNPYIHREERQRLEEEILNWREEAPSLLKHLLGSELREMKVMRERGPTLDLPGFPWLGARLRFAIRKHMVRHLDDFYLRRTSLWLARQDHGWPVAEFLASIWAEELDKTPADVEKELARLAQKLSELEAWRREPWLDRVNAKVA